MKGPEARAREPAPEAPSIEFKDLVRDALLHLYEAGYLGSHPLAKLAEVPPGGSAAASGKRLLQLLLDAIEALRPAPGFPTDARTLRLYHLLELRYIGGMSAGDAMAQLGISKSQYQRDHLHALDSVANVLWERWRTVQPVIQRPAESGTREALALLEAEQLAVQMDPDHVDLGELLTTLLDLVRPIAEDSHTTLALRAFPDLPTIWGDRVVLRQVFLGLLNLALSRCPGGSVEITLTPGDLTLSVTLCASPARGSASPPAMKGGDLEIEVARRFMGALGGEFIVESASTIRWPWRVHMTFPIARRPVLLVVDNHADFFGLVERYLAEVSWQAVGARDVREGLSLAAELHPNAILLDVMMPRQDGWDLLLALKKKPETQSIPVIICSVLYEPQLAKVLGAVAYLAKPISQADLLGALTPFGIGGRGTGAVD